MDTDGNPVDPVDFLLDCVVIARSVEVLDAVRKGFPDEMHRAMDTIRQDLFSQCDLIERFHVHCSAIDYRFQQLLKWFLEKYEFHPTLTATQVRYLLEDTGMTYNWEPLGTFASLYGYSAV